MQILMAGSSGFLGSPLVDRLRDAGHRVVRLVRRPANGPDEITWDPAGPLDPAALAGIDAVVNLTGSPLGMRLGPVQLPVRPWTDSYRREFRGSRVGSTRTLAEAIAAAGSRPAVLLSGSGVGWYADTGDEEVDESGAPGDNFLARTAQLWEEATAPAATAGVRVVLLRTGFPLGRDGGLLGPQLLPFRLGVGGRTGHGRQWQPWMSMADWLSAVQFLLDRDDLAGPVNMVGPAPVRNAELTRAIGEVLGRPAVVPVPGPVLSTVLGDFGRDALASKRVLPGALTRAGFTFRHPDVRSALRAALDRPAAHPAG